MRHSTGAIFCSGAALRFGATTKCAGNWTQRQVSGAATALFMSASQRVATPLTSLVMAECSVPLSGGGARVFHEESAAERGSHRRSLVCLLAGTQPAMRGTTGRSHDALLRHNGGALLPRPFLVGATRGSAVLEVRHAFRTCCKRWRGSNSSSSSGRRRRGRRRSGSRRAVATSLGDSRLQSFATTPRAHRRAEAALRAEAYAAPDPRAASWLEAQAEGLRRGCPRRRWLHCCARSVALSSSPAPNERVRERRLHLALATELAANSVLGT